MWTVAQDPPGTAAGAWFLDPNLAGVNNLSLGIRAGNPTCRDPRMVTGSHCYQNQPMPGTSDGYIMLNVISATQMQVAFSPLACDEIIPIADTVVVRPDPGGSGP